MFAYLSVMIFSFQDIFFISSINEHLLIHMFMLRITLPLALNANASVNDSNPNPLYHQFAAKRGEESYTIIKKKGD